MAKKDTPTRRLLDLPPPVRHEIARAQATIATEKVKAADAKVKIEAARTQIEKLKGN